MFQMVPLLHAIVWGIKYDYLTINNISFQSEVGYIQRMEAGFGSPSPPTSDPPGETRRLQYTKLVDIGGPCGWRVYRTRSLAMHPPPPREPSWLTTRPRHIIQQTRDNVQRYRTALQLDDWLSGDRKSVAAEPGMAELAQPTMVAIKELHRRGASQRRSVHRRTLTGMWTLPLCRLTISCHGSS